MKYIIHESNIKTVSEKEYWNNIIKNKELECLKHPCGDCAMVTGFYVDIANELIKQPLEIQEQVQKRWYCHNSPNKSCAGIKEFLNSNDKSSKQK